MKTSKKKLVPSYDYVLIKPVSDMEQVSRGGLLIPGGKTDLSKGVVVAVGQGVPAYTGELVPCKHKVGDTVVYGKGYGFVEHYLGGEAHHLVKDQSIIGVITDDE